MQRMNAFIDESGAFGFDFEKPNVSTHFIITAILVEESRRDELRTEVEKIRRQYFREGEIKSKNIGGNHERRLRILNEIIKLDFAIFSVIVDKRELDSIGFSYKKSFYKFLNNLVHKELRSAFSSITVFADETGSNEYMASFVDYFKNRQEGLDLFGNAELLFKNSKNDVLIQLADFISGTLAKEFDENQKTTDTPVYTEILDSKITRLEFYPRTYKTFNLETNAIASDYDKDIAELCFKKSIDFIDNNLKSKDSIVQAQIQVLKYLLFRFMNNDLRTYISTQELKNQLVYMKLPELSDWQFRKRIIGSLRDNNVIIASSSAKKGYKIPAKKSELYDYLNHDMNIISPMLKRLKKTRDLVKLATLNEVDLFDDEGLIGLKRYFDKI